MPDPVLADIDLSIITHGREKTEPGGPGVIAYEVAEAFRRQGLRANSLHIPGDSVAEGGICHFLNAPGLTPLLTGRTVQQSKAIVVTPTHLHWDDSWRWDYWVDRTLPAALSAKPDRAVAMIQDCLVSEPSRWSRLGRKARRRRRRQYKKALQPLYTDYHTIASRCDAVIALSNWEADVMAVHGVAPERIHTVANPVDVDRFGKASAEPAIAKLGTTGFVLCVGRVGYRKNQLMIAAAMRDMPHQLVLVGKIESPNYAALIRHLMGERVIFIEYMSHATDLLPSLYQSAAVFVLPSWAEGVPLSGLEAWASGVPMIFSDLPPHRETFGQVAQFVDPADPESLKLAIQNALVGAGGPRHVKAGSSLLRHTYRAHCASLKSVYRSALAARGDASNGRGSK